MQKIPFFHNYHNSVSLPHGDLPHLPVVPAPAIGWPPKPPAFGEKFGKAASDQCRISDMGISWEYHGNIMGIWFVIISITMGVPTNGWFIGKSN